MTPRADLLDRAVERFSELCDLAPDEQERRLAELEDAELRAVVADLLLGDREADLRLERPAEAFVEDLDLESGPLALLDDRVPESEDAEAVVARLAARGAKIEHHRLGDELARGGMGVILEAWDEDLDRRLAMKVVEAGKAPAGSRRFRRFLDEARIAAQLDHPGIVPVHDVGIDAEGRAFFTMKLVKGETLTEVLRRVEAGEEGWTQARALGVLLRVCEAMAYAHSKGVVHRDLKPSNVMVGRFGEVYVMDWGVAWLRSRRDERDLRPRPVADAEPTGEIQSGTPVVTMDGTVVGTPYYMSPEQARGGLIDERSDVYAVGALLYTLLAGHPPYRDPNEDEAHRAPSARVLERVVDGPPPALASLGRRVPAALEAICAKAMARAPEQRYASMVEFADDLRAELEGRVVRAHRTGALAELARWTRRNRALAAALAGGVLVLAVGLVVALALWRQAKENALLALERERAADAAADEARRQEADVTRLLERFRFVVQEELAGILWPPHPAQLPKYEGWLATAKQVIDNIEPSSKRLAAIESTALPRTEADIEHDRRTHPRYRDLVRLRARLRAAEVRAGLAEPPAFEVDPGSLPDDPAELNRLAWTLVRPDREHFGREPEGLALARLALERVTDDAEYADVSNTIAWALFLNGLDDEAIAYSQEALYASGSRRRIFERRHAELLAAIDAARSESLDELRTDHAELEREVSRRRTWRFEDERDATWHRVLTDFLDDAEALADPEAGLIDGISPEHGWGIARRAAWARTVGERTVSGEEARNRWTDAIAAIADRARSPMYEGLRIVPQLGLVPLGADPDSGLQEFGHPLTGEVPGRDARGRLVLDEGSGLVFVLVPGGTFWMGAQATDPDGPNHDPRARGPEGPVHQVEVRPFFLSKYEMTQAQWERFTGANPSRYAPGSEGALRLDLDDPVEQVSWREADTVCRRLGLLLPTEAQWEYAARAGTSTPWWTGSDRESLRGTVNLADQSAKVGANWPDIEDWPELFDGFPVHAPVDEAGANPFGLVGVHGNVSEWCRDAFDDRFYVSSPLSSPVNDAQTGTRVYRGGNFRQSATYARLSHRGNDDEGQRSSYLGLRPARRLVLDER